ncbi:MAG: 2'-5' RNA ligase family protein [Dehalococcoidia bacterium]
MNEADRETAERHQAIWEEFRCRPAVSPWTGRLPLPPGVTATAGFVIPVDDATVRRRLQEIVERLEATGAVTAFEPGYWHITIVPPVLLTSGNPTPPRLLPETFIQEALEKGRKAVRDLGPFEVAVRGLNGFHDVLVAVPYDGGRGRELGRLLRSAMPELPERYPDGHEPLPHISLTQYARDDRLEEMVELVQRERGTGFGHFQARRLEMFVLPWREGVPGRVKKHQIPLVER